MTLIANNHFFRRQWSMELLHSMILRNIWPEILFFSSFAALVALISELTVVDLAISRDALTMLGIVLAVSISFRTSSANERYQDGAKSWSNIRAASRILANLIWLHVPNERPGDNEDGRAQTMLEIILEKKTMINLIDAFAVSTKHLLRGEPGVFYEDLYHNVAFLPRYASENGQASDILPLWHIHGGRRMRETDEDVQRKDTLLALVQVENPLLQPAHIPPEVTVFDYFGILRLPRHIYRRMMRRTGLRPEGPPKRPKKRLAYSEIVESTVPLELHLILSNYSAFLMNNEYVESTIASAMCNALSVLHDALAQLERVCNNPIPFGYTAHLRMCVWLYLLFLPLQMLEELGYLVIPATSLVCFLLTGFLEIGQEIENPFNYGLNDLDLDWYCDTLRQNLHEITAHSIWEDNEVPCMPNPTSSRLSVVVEETPA